MSFLTVQTCHLAVFRSRGGARLQCRRHGELGPGDLPRDGAALRPPRVVQLQQVHGHADRGPRDCPHGQSAPHHVTSRHVTSRHGVLGWAARWPACWLLAWLWAGLVDGWFGFEEPKIMVMIAVVTRWWLACWLLAWLLASLVDGWLALRGCDLVRRAEDDGDDCSSNSMVFIVTTVATIV